MRPTRTRNPPPGLMDYAYGEGDYDDAIQDYLTTVLDDDRPLEVVDVVDGEDYAYRPPGQKEVWPYARPSWRTGTYDRIKTAQTVSGVLYCAICKGAITLDISGKEVWKSKSGKKHYTRPPIDHDSPDWIVRLANVKKKADQTYGNADNLSYTEKLTVRGWIEDAFHEDDLRIAHMKCNSGKAKQLGYN